jgi:hypothetical protein
VVLMWRAIIMGSKPLLMREVPCWAESELDMVWLFYVLMLVWLAGY